MSNILFLNKKQGKNLDKLNEMIAIHGNDNENYQQNNPPVAIFDFDNTCIKNDIGTLTTLWMINHNLIYQPPNKDWGLACPLLTSAGQKALKSVCDSQGEIGSLICTDQSNHASKRCADEIVTIYQHGKTVAGDPAFIFERTEYINPSYAFSNQLRAGHTPTEIHKITQDVMSFALNSSVEIKQKVGNIGGFETDICCYQQMQNLMSVLRQKGFEIWIVSASSQAIVEVSAKLFDVDINHVIGTRNSIDYEEKLTYRFQGVGKFSENNTDIISYRDGKRWWINKLVFGENNINKQMKKTDEITDRFIFAAGDSDTDLSMLQDAKYKLVVSYDKENELLQYTKHNEGGNWMIINNIY